MRPRADRGVIHQMVTLPPFPARSNDAHKGDVGRIVIIGGRLDDVGMVGAPALAANAALRAGAGLVQIITPPEAQSAVGVLAPCATTRALDADDEKNLAILARGFHADVVAIGPGLSPRIHGSDVIRCLEEFDGPIVVDADALNALATIGPWRLATPARAVLTPHPGEMQRLMTGLGWPADEAKSNDPPIRLRCAQGVAKATQSIVILKGRGTVVTDGHQTYVNATGHSGMATAGSGDVLTGVLAALIGQKMTPWEAAVLGVHLHGRAGELAAQRHGSISLIATDLLEGLAEAIREHTQRQTEPRP